MSIVRPSLPTVKLVFSTEARDRLILERQLASGLDAGFARRDLDEQSR